MHIGLGLGLTRISGGGASFSPLSLFASGEAGAWYDPSDLSTLYQDSFGATPVTAAGQPVGLVLDKSQGPAGAELVTNGTFDTDLTGWTSDGSTAGYEPTWVSTGGGAAEIVRDVSGIGRLNQLGILEVGKTYLVTWDVVSSTGSTGILINDTSTGTLTTVGSKSFVFVAGATGFQIRVGGSVTFVIDNVSVRELPGNHLTQATAAARPVYQAAGGLHWLEFDGVDDFLVSPTITPGVDKAQVFAGVTKEGTADGGWVCETSDTASARNGAFYLSAPNGGGLAAPYVFITKGTTPQGQALSASFGAPETRILTGLGDISGDSVILRLDGTQVAQDTGDRGTVNYNAYPLFVGMRNGTSFPFDGNIYGLVVRFGANLDADTISETETYLAAKSGVTL